MKKIKDLLSQDEMTRLAANVCDVFEGVLARHDIMIPDEDREEYGDDESQACLFGSTYYEVEDSVKEIIGEIEVDEEK